MDNPSDSLIARLTAAYWHDKEACIDGPERMAAVVSLLAKEIQSWAPSLEDSKIVHLSINGVAQQLLTRCNINQ